MAELKMVEKEKTVHGRHPVRSELGAIWAIERELSAMFLRHQKEMRALGRKHEAEQAELKDRREAEIIRLQEVTGAQPGLLLDPAKMKWVMPADPVPQGHPQPNPTVYNFLAEGAIEGSSPHGDEN